MFDFIVTPLKDNYAEAAPQFKAGAAEALCDIAKAIGAGQKDYTNTKILPILQDLLKDDNSEVKLKTLENFLKVAHVIGTEVITQPFVTTL